MSNSVLIRNPKLHKHKFNPSRMLTLNMGQVIPNFCELANPGDIWKLSSTSLTRTMPMIAPIFGRVRIYQHYFFVPLRLLMNDFESFITGGIDGNDATPHPYIKSPSTGWEAGSLMDHLGYCTNYFNEDNTKHVVGNLKGSAFPVRAYNRVINDWYINENIEGMLRELSLEPGEDTTTDTTIFKKVWRPDYFINNLPWAQRGPEIMLPLGVSAPVYGSEGKPLSMTNTSVQNFGTYPLVTTHVQGTGGSNSYLRPQWSGDKTINNYEWNVTPKSVGVDSNIYTDLTEASSISVNDLRDSLALKVASEISARTGGRLIEWLLGHWGVRSSNKTLQRSQYLGGGVSSLFVDAVEQTSSTDNTSPQGNLSGRGTSVNNVWGFKHRFEEPGVILGLMSIMPDALYYQGQRRWLNYNSRLDYPLPAFAKLGEQETKEVEIFAQGEGSSYTASDGTVVSDDTTLGFNPRYEECRFIPSSIHANFKTNLKFWTLARHFENPPLLNSQFMQGEPSKRVFAVTDQQYDSFLTEVGFNIKCWRKIPKHGIPTTFGLLS
ncbi:major capsid protein [Sigmofec virus UA08Rod_6997]|uniref:Major capsid protein n=1 Tax=Sigmofec virus UA08Rod_6997 TaxID=2929243 RepID=A0A976R757_9VIRU|nr:major capsid protein [Sigmofec virus UA08Rod_6997]